MHCEQTENTAHILAAERPLVKKLARAYRLRDRDATTTAGHACHMRFSDWSPPVERGETRLTHVACGPGMTHHLTSPASAVELSASIRDGMGEVLAHPLLDPADRAGSLARAFAAIARAARQVA